MNRKVLQYVADYTCTKCGAISRETARAYDYHNALTKLPRYIYPEGHLMRREASPEIRRIKP